MNTSQYIEFLKSENGFDDFIDSFGESPTCGASLEGIFLAALLKKINPEKSSLVFKGELTLKQAFDQVNKEANKDMEFVYFIGSTYGGLVKIGRTFDLCGRLKKLQSGSPVPLEVIATTFQDVCSEKHLHEKFSGSRVYGEWFQLTRNLIDFMAQLEDSNVVDFLDRRGICQ